MSDAAIKTVIEEFPLESKWTWYHDKGVDHSKKTEEKKMEGKDWEGGLKALYHVETVSLSSSPSRYIYLY